MSISDLKINYRTPSKRPIDPTVDPKKLKPGQIGPTFYSGDTIEGDITCEVTGSVKCKRVVAKLVGRSRCSWTTHHGQHTQHHSANLQVAKAEIVLWDGTQQVGPFGEAGLPMGYQRWEFTFKLPEDIPSSCVVPDGRIYYNVKAVVEIKGSRDKKTKEGFQVLQRRSVDHLQTPASKDNTKHLCCCCCKSGPISVRGSIDKQGYRFDDMVEIRDIFAQNQARRALGNVRLRIDRVAELRASDGSRRWHTFTISEMKSQEVLAPGDSISMPPVQLSVGHTIPSIETSPVTVRYNAQITVIIPRGFNLSADIPITVSGADVETEIPPE